MRQARRLLGFCGMPDFETTEEDPGIDGPDYVALVIEWPEDAATEEISDEVTRPTAQVGGLRALARAVSLHKVAAAFGAAVVVALAAWRVRRHRAAC